eukprot:PITA_07287
MDVKINFLNGVVEEEIYIEYPKGFETYDWESRAESRDNCMLSNKCPNYGDVQLIFSCKEDLAREFEMKYIGLRQYFLRMEVWQGNGELFVSQEKCASKILQIFHMENCKHMETPLATKWRKENSTLGEEVDATIYRRLVGYLMYLMNTRLKMFYAVNQLSQAVVRPTKLYWKKTKNVLRYLRGTTKHGLCYKRTKGVKLQGLIDVDWVGSPSEKKMISSVIFIVGFATISWYNRKQRFVALNSTKVEYMVASKEKCEAIWVRKIIVVVFG